MKKLIAFMLAALMICALAVSCTTADPGKDISEAAQESKPEQQSEEPSEVSEEPGERLILPDKKWNVVLEMVVNKNRYYEEYEFWWDDEVADENPVVNEVVERTRKIKNDYGIDIHMIYIEGLGKPEEYLETCIAGGMPLDLVADGAQSLAPKVITGNYLDIYEENLKFNDGKGWLQLDASWWDQSIQRDLSLGHKLFFVTGDICVSDDESTYAMLFNKDLIKMHNLEDPYELIENNEWTIDKMIEMGKKVVLMHGSKMSIDPADGDVFGIVTQGFDQSMLILGLGQTMITKDNNDLPVINIMDPRHVKAHSKVFDMFIDDSYCGFSDIMGFGWEKGNRYAAEVFANGNSLFMPNNINYITNANGDIAKSELNYGIIPMPKLDEEQEGYTSSSNAYWLRVIGIPNTNNANIEPTLIALEALAYYGKEMITPAYYDQVLKGQKTKDEQSEAMLDLIFKNRTYDIGTIYDFGDSTAQMIQFYNYVIGGRPSNNIASVYEKYAPIFQKSIDEYVEYFASMN